MTKYKISVVIGTFNLKDKLMLVLDSFNKQSFSFNEFELVVVDSSSTDGSYDAVKKNKYNYSLNYIVKENTGKASARNIGVKNSNSDLIIITDADMIADKDFIKSHYDLHQQTGFKFIIEGKTYVLNEEKSPVEKYIRRPYIKKIVKHRQQLDFFYCLTGNLSMPKSFFVGAGYFDEKFENYGWEDIDLGYRLIKQLHKQLIYSDLAVNYHFHVWSDYDELLRKENMGKSVHLLINKHKKLKNILGINFINLIAFKYFVIRQDKIHYWIKLLQQKKLNNFKKYLLNEYFYYKGYYESRN